MNTQDAGSLPGPTASLLAILSVTCFWLLPFSPLAAIGAVSMTRGGSGCGAKLALTGAVLCITHTVAMSLLFARVCLELRW